MNKLSLAFLLQLMVTAPAFASDITAVCDRSPQIVAQLERILEKKCNEMSEADLLEVDGLFLDWADPKVSTTSFVNGQQVTTTPPDVPPMKELKAGDFSGLDNVMMVSVSANELQLKDIMLLKDLPRLRFLDASRLKIKSIPAGSFDSFKALEELAIGSPELEMIEPYTFANSKTLRRINVSGTTSLKHVSKAAFFGVEVTGLPSDFAVDPSRTKWNN